MNDFNLRAHKPYQYRVYNNKAELEDYSGGFLSKEAAEEWYNTHGKWLESHFKRTLILVKHNYESNLNLENACN